MPKETQAWLFLEAFSPEPVHFTPKITCFYISDEQHMYKGFRVENVLWQKFSFFRVSKNTLEKIPDFPSKK